jgi:alkaline phosphatase D
MIARLTVFLISLSFYLTIIAQTSGIISGPMLGPVELRDAKIWLEVSPAVKSVSLQYKKKNDTKTKTILYKGQLGNEFNPLQLTIGGLEFNTTYEYQFIINGKPSAAKGEFTTKDLWPYRRPVPDFSFLTGSCSYFNEPAYDRVYTDMVQLNRLATPYGKDSSIFEPMAKEKASFMLWLGDNWYTRDVDYFSEWGLWYRASHDRAQPVLQKFLKSMPHIATWDDHDFGPNDIGKNYILKNISRTIWKNYWCNPSYGENEQGIYTLYSWADTDIFLTDDRWWRSADRMKDSIDGKPNPDKRMLGRQQMEWLKNSLLYSIATFKIIVTGSQVLNPVSPFDKFSRFPAEYDELMQFLKDYKINGVLFLTGDRHHSEIIKVERPGTYPLYDVTVSPFSSGTHKFFGAETVNPYRVFALDEKQNYARVSVTGKRTERKLTVEFLGVKGEKLGEWAVAEKELKTPVTGN